MAFYADKEVKTNIAQIKGRYDNVLWSSGEAQRLLESTDKAERKLGKVMQEGLEAGWKQGRYQIFLLSRPGDPQHVILEKPLVNNRAGKGSAFVRKQKYTSVHQLRHAQDIWEL